MSYLDDLRKVNAEYESGDRNFGEMALGTTAATGRAVGDVVGTALDYMVPDALGVGEFFANRMRDAANTDLGKAVIGEVQDFKKEHPVTSRMFGELFESTQILPMGRMFGMANPDMKGFGWTSANVYKPGNYNPKEVDVPEMLKQWDGTDTWQEKAVDALRYGKGTVQWGTEGLKNYVGGLFNPYTRAIYSDYGLSVPARKALQEYALDPTDANRTMAMMQGLASSNIRRQAGNNTAIVQDFSEDIAKRSALMAKGQKSPYIDIGTDQGWYHKNVTRPFANRNVPEKNREQWISRSDSDIIESVVGKSIKDPKNTKVIVKRPADKYTGHHYNDVLLRNPVFTDLANAMEDYNYGLGFDSRQQLKDVLEKFQVTNKDGSKNFYIKYDNADDIAEKGVWIEMPITGSAKVEGAVNALVKIEPDGSVLGVMSDLHNYGEKLPGLREAQKVSIPKSVMAVTPPMRGHLRKLRTRQLKMPYVGADIPSTKKGVPFDVSSEELARMATIDPTRASVIRQAGQVASNANLLGQGMFNSMNNEDVQP
jgi:hypothetical protein